MKIPLKFLWILFFLFFSFTISWCNKIKINDLWNKSSVEQEKYNSEKKWEWFSSGISSNWTYYEGMIRDGKMEWERFFYFPNWTKMRWEMHNDMGNWKFIIITKEWIIQEWQKHNDMMEWKRITYWLTGVAKMELNWHNNKPIWEAKFIGNDWKIDFIK